MERGIHNRFLAIKGVIPTLVVVIVAAVPPAIPAIFQLIHTCTAGQLADFFQNRLIHRLTVTIDAGRLDFECCKQNVLFGIHDGQHIFEALRRVLAGVHMDVHMYEHKNDSSYTFDELRTRMSHFGELAMTSDIMEGFCRNFPEYTDQMKVFIQRDTGDASLCRTALSVLESFVTLLQQLVDGKTDLRQLIEATLVDEDGRPRTEHGQRPSELLVELAEKGDSTYQKYHKLEDDIHIQTRYKRPTDNKKSGISAATFYASDTLPALLFLEFVQMCAQDLPVAVCESCHRLFVPFSSRAKYCERVLDPETGATCKDIAAKMAYAEELKGNKAKELYNKMRNRYQMRCSRAPDNQKMRDEYNAWRKQAQMALSKYQLGEISWAEFVDSLTCSSKAE